MPLSTLAPRPAWVRLFNPTVWLKTACSLDALVVNAVQLSELSDGDGTPLSGYEEECRGLAQLVAFEARQLRRHWGSVKDA